MRGVGSVGDGVGPGPGRSSEGAREGKTGEFSTAAEEGLQDPGGAHLAAPRAGAEGAGGCLPRGCVAGGRGLAASRTPLRERCERSGERRWGWAGATSYGCGER